MHERYWLRATATGFYGIALLTLIAACSSDAGSNSRNFNTLGGEVTLQLANAPAGAVTGLALSDGIETTAVTLPAGQTSGTVLFTFPTGLSQGTPYSVSVASNPSGIECVASNNSGTMQTSSIATIKITCSDSAYLITGNVDLNLMSSYPGSLTVLLSDGSELASVDVASPQAGTTLSPSFVFKTPFDVGVSYSVIPTNPTGLTCTSPSTGTVESANVSVLVTCSDESYPITVSVSGLQFGGTIKLSDDVDSEVVSQSSLDKNGQITFQAHLPYGATYNVQLQAESLVQCTLANGNGMVLGPVTDVAITCSLPEIAILAGQPGGTTGGTTNNGFNPLAASFFEPFGVAVDLSGSIYVSDSGANVVRKIYPDGVVSTLAGNGTTGNSDGTGNAASFDNPQGIAIDASGNLYVADNGNSSIRKVTPAGAVTTFGNLFSDAICSQGFACLSAVAVDTVGNLYVLENAQVNFNLIIATGIEKITPAGVETLVAESSDGTGSPANASFIGARGIAVDLSGNIYVADTENDLIRLVTPAGVVSTFAGTGALGSADGNGAAASFNGPQGVSVDSSGNVYVADSDNNVVRKITPAHDVSTLAGSGSLGFADGTGTNASFYNLYSVTSDQSGNLYVPSSDSGGGVIRKISAAAVVTTVAGVAPPPSGSVDDLGNAASFNAPSGVAFDRLGNVYVADNNVIRRITPLGMVSIYAGSGAQGSTDGHGTAASFNDPRGVAVDASGNVYVADTGSGLVRKITPTSDVTTVSPGSFQSPTAIAVDSSGNIYVADESFDGRAPIYQVTPAGVVTLVANLNISAFVFFEPTGVAVDSSANLYVTVNEVDTTQFQTSELMKITAAGVVSSLAPVDSDGVQASFNTLTGVAVDPPGNVYVADSLNFQIRRIAPDGMLVTTFAGSDSGFSFNPGSVPGQIGSVNSIAVSTPDTSGNWNMVFSVLKQNAIAEIVGGSAYVN